MRGSPGFIEGEIRIDFWRLYRRMLPYFTVLVIGAWLGMALAERQRVLVGSYSDLIGLAILVGTFFGFMALLIWLLAAVYPTGVGADGMRSYDLFGFYREMRWDEMRKVWYRNILGIPVICCTRSSWFDMVCISPTAKDLPAAQALLGEYVPLGHSIRPLLIEHGLLDESAASEQALSMYR